MTTLESFSKESLAQTTATGSSGSSGSGNRSKIIRGPWADEPWPLMETPSRSQNITHPVLHIANEMTHGYNAALRGLNAIFLQAPHITVDEDIADLLFLTHCWSVWVLNSHMLRKTQLLPQFEQILGKPGVLISGLGGELDFVPALEGLLQYAGATQPKPELYNPLVLQGLIQELAPVFRAHLACEMAIMVDMIQLCGPPGSAEAESRAGRLLQLYLSSEADASNSMDRFIVPPMLVRMRDTTYEGGNNWPGLSVLAVHAVAERLSPAHEGAWRFLPCDVWGKPRELPFLGHEDIKGKGKAKVLFDMTPASQGSTESLETSP